MINSNWFTSFVTWAKDSLVISTVLVSTRVTLSWYKNVQKQQPNIQHKQDF